MKILNLALLLSLACCAAGGAGQAAHPTSADISVPRPTQTRTIYTPYGKKITCTTYSGAICPQP